MEMSEWWEYPTSIIQYNIPSMKRPPPHLKAIFPFDGLTDLYRDLAYYGGICNTEFPLVWYQGIKEKTRAVSQAQKILGEKLDVVQEALKSDAIKNRPELVQILNNPEINPMVFDLLLASIDGPYYWERSSHKQFGKIKIPTYTGSDWKGRDTS